MSNPVNAQRLAQLQYVVETDGFRAALGFLNGLVPHRYTVAYRFDGAAFYAFEMVDKLGQPIPKLFERVPLEESFCQYILEDGTFKTDNSLDEPRLDGHVHRGTVQSYIGLPLTDNFGELYGTFCHLDHVPHGLTDDEHAFLNKAASLLSKHLPKQCP